MKRGFGKGTPRRKEWKAKWRGETTATRRRNRAGGATIGVLRFSGGIYSSERKKEGGKRSHPNLTKREIPGSVRRRPLNFALLAKDQNK